MIRLSKAFIWTMMLLFPFSATGQPEELFEGCAFRHLFLSGEYFQSLRYYAPVEYYGAEVPVYIGYIRTIESVRAEDVWHEDIKEFSFVKVTELPINNIDEVMRTIMEEGYVYDDLHKLYLITDKGFMGALSRLLSDFYASSLILEYYSHNTDYPYPTESALSAGDFEFVETCTFEPYADPPQYCIRIKAELANKDELLEKIRNYKNSLDNS